MWPFSSRKVRRSKPAHVCPSFRPRVRALEDRCLLSAGALDPTFGNGAGYVTTSISSGNDVAHSALIQPNGEIVAVGSADDHAELAVERYNLNGSLDTSFGSGGIALASFGSAFNGGGSSALDPYAGTANGNDDVVQEGSYNGSYQVLVRYNTNGNLDATFGTGGKVMTAFPGMSGIAATGHDTGVVVTRAGQIVALNDNGGQFVLARYNSNGSLDTTFGQGGYVITTVPGGLNGYYTLLPQPNGDLIVTGAQAGGVWHLYRFNANGTLDPSFGNQGIVTTTAPGGPEGAVLYPNAGTPNDGQIVLVGQASNGTVLLARYNPNGGLDTAFGTGGLMQTQVSFGYLGPQAALDANGRIVVTGWDGSATEVARFNINGTPDTTFGNGGVLITTVGTSSIGNAVAIYPNAGTGTDGEIVVVGYSSNGTKDNVLVARYLPQATSPYFVITGPSTLTAGTAGSFTISVLNPNGTADTSYSGTVQITSSDPKAVLPANFTISGGTGTFNATLKTAGVQSLTATDTVTSSINGSDAGIVVQPAAAAQFILSAPSSVKSEAKFSVTLTVEDTYGNVVTGYVGTVYFTSSDSTATLPASYTFTAAGAGVHTFTNAVILKKKGNQTLTVTDTMNSALTVTHSIDVT